MSRFFVLSLCTLFCVIPLRAQEPHNGFYFVDLGLSVKWATTNIGYDVETYESNYYAWGEVSVKTNYKASTSMTYPKSMAVFDNATMDVANALWGGGWRMPTKEEFEELLNKDNCYWTWIVNSSKAGYLVTSKKNGRSIFLPAVGYRVGMSITEDCVTGCYWSSTPCAGKSSEAYSLIFFNGDRYVDASNRYLGYVVRPVLD